MNQHYQPKQAAANSPSSTGTTPKLSEYFTRGLQHAKAVREMGGDPWTAISPSLNPELWQAWSVYFLSRYGAQPAAWRAVEAQQQDSFTVPADRPEHFDLQYTPPAFPPPRPKRPPPERFADGGHVGRMRQWLAETTGATLESINRAQPETRISRGFDELRRELIAAGAANAMSMKNPHPIPAEMITKAGRE